MAEYLPPEEADPIDPVAEVGSAVKPKRSQSYQCTDDAEKSGAYAQGSLLCNTDHSWSVDSGMAQMSKIEEFRREFNEKLEQLEVRLDKKNDELMKVVQERDKLSEKLQQEIKEKERNAECVKKLKEEKSNLEVKVESLQKEVKLLREQIQNSINHNESLEKQINKLQDHNESSSCKSKTSTNYQAIMEKLQVAISTVFSEYSTSSDIHVEEDMMKSAIQKVSGIKGNGDYKNGATGSHQHAQGKEEEEDPAESNNRSYYND